MLHVDPLIGFQDFHGRRLAFEAGIAADVIRPVGAMLGKLYEVFVARGRDAGGGQPAAGDQGAARWWRSTPRSRSTATRSTATPTSPSCATPSAEDPQERMAKERGLTYVKLDGNVGILGNGAGLVMSTLDVVAQAGGRPGQLPRRRRRLQGRGDHQRGRGDPLRREGQARCCSTSSAASPAATRWRTGLIEAFDQIKPDVPFVVRLDGTNDEEGRALLAEADLPNVHIETTMLGAAEKVVELAALMAILVDSDTKLCVSGITGREGTFHGLNNRDYGTQRRGRRHARQGRPGRGGHAGVRHLPRRRRARPAPTRR